MRTTSGKSLRHRILSGLSALVLAASTSLAQVAPALAATADGVAEAYPETVLGAFWTSDSDQTDTLYLSTDGINFERICTPYLSGPGANGLVRGTDHIYTLHDPGLFYTPNNQTFWLISGYVENGAFRYMAGCSQDLLEWSWPDPANGERFYPTVAPDMGGHTTAQGFNTAGTDAACDPDGSTVWVVTSLGFYANHNGMGSEYDVMHPYIMKVSNLSPNVDITEGHYDWHGLAPLGTNGPLVPINLPDEDISNNWIDPSLYYEDGWWYLSIKAWGVQNRIYRTQDLNRASDPSAWSIYVGNVVTGYEGASMTKLNYSSSYMTYVDKLADWPPNSYDGTTGVFAFRSPYVIGRNDWTNLGRIVTKDENGNRIANRHGSVLNIKDQHALEVVWNLHDRLYRHGKDAHWQDEWVDAGGGNWFVYKHGVMRTDAWIELRGDWYFVGRDGQMLVGKQWLDFQGKGGYYFFNPDHDGTYGKMRTDWFLNSDGYWYYMETEAGTGKQGMVVTGDRWIGGKLYHFDAEGRCLNP